MKNKINPAHGTMATRMATLQQRIAVAVQTRREIGGLPLMPPTIIAASKTQPVSAIEAMVGLGVSDFGENRVQEAQEKWPALKAQHPHVTLHLIGALQSNKAADAVALFDVIQTIDRPKIADALAAAEQQLDLHRHYYIQVNIGEEPQKSGILPPDLPALLTHCQTLRLDVVGLMAVPPAAVNPAPYFALLAKLAARHGLSQLSMGMSEDYEAAIRLGATHVRIGTALFGARE